MINSYSTSSGNTYSMYPVIQNFINKISLNNILKKFIVFSLISLHIIKYILFVILAVMKRQDMLYMSFNGLINFPKALSLGYDILPLQGATGWVKNENKWLQKQKINKGVLYD